MMRHPNVISMPVRLPQELSAFIRARAERDMRSINSVLVEAVRKLKETAQREEAAA
jgi:hypothetical protein